MTHLHPDGPVEARDRPSLRYIIGLMTAALSILVLGVLIRPKTNTGSGVPSNELATLPELSQRKVFRDMAEYVANRAAEMSPSVVYLPGSHSSGLVIGRDSVLSTSTEDGPGLHVLIAKTSDSTVSAAPTLSLETLSSRWLLIVGKTAEGRPLSLAGLAGGLVPFQCGDDTVHEIVFAVQLPAALLGAGVFDFDGNALGLVIRCDQRLALIPLRDLRDVLRRQSSSEAKLWSRYGLRLTTGDSLAGTRVAEVLVGGAADRAGIWPGDTIQMVASENGRARVDSGTIGTSQALSLRVRGGRHRMKLSLFPDSTGPQFRSPVIEAPAGLLLDRIEPASRLGRAGLHRGDRILQIGPTRRPTASALARVLSNTIPTFLVYQRDNRRAGVMLP